jgi:hypothetical protein
VCHGHLDAQHIEREIRDRLGVLRPALQVTTAARQSARSGVLGKLSGLAARLRRMRLIRPRTG